jgi:hypothetical protein
MIYRYVVWYPIIYRPIAKSIQSYDTDTDTYTYMKIRWIIVF